MVRFTNPGIELKNFDSGRLAVGASPFTITFARAQPNTNYKILLTQALSSSQNIVVLNVTNKNTTTCVVEAWTWDSAVGDTGAFSSTLADDIEIDWMVFQ